MQRQPAADRARLRGLKRLSRTFAAIRYAPMPNGTTLDHWEAYLAAFKSMLDTMAGILYPKAPAKPQPKRNLLAAALVGVV